MSIGNVAYYAADSRRTTLRSLMSFLTAGWFQSAATSSWTIDRALIARLLVPGVWSVYVLSATALARMVDTSDCHPALTKPVRPREIKAPPTRSEANDSSMAVSGSSLVLT